MPDKVESKGDPSYQGPVLTLFEERKGQLEAKLSEYRGRLDERPTMHPELQLIRHSDAMYKITVLERLLKDGRISTWELSREMAKKLGSEFDARLFNRACAVISDYNQTGGANLSSGTGLPPAKNSNVK